MFLVCFAARAGQAPELPFGPEAQQRGARAAKRNSEEGAAWDRARSVDAADCILGPPAGQRADCRLAVWLGSARQFETVEAVEAVEGPAPARKLPTRYANEKKVRGFSRKRHLQQRVDARSDPLIARLEPRHGPIERTIGVCPYF